MASHHTFGESCMLKEESNTFTRRASFIGVDPPVITAQFFYCSALPVDDPLAAIPAPSGRSATKSSRVPPRPFSVHDNIALEDAWLKLRKPVHQPVAKAAQRQWRLGKEVVSNEDSSSELYAASITPKRRNTGPHAFNATQVAPRGRAVEGEDPTPAENGSLGTRAIKPEDCIGNRNVNAISGPVTESTPKETTLGNHLTILENIVHQPLQETAPVSSEEIIHDEVEGGLLKSRKSRSFFRKKEVEDAPNEDEVSPRSSARRLSRGRQEAADNTIVTGKSPDTTGTPFLRVPARLRRSRSRSPNLESQKAQIDGADSPGRDYRPKQSSPLGVKPRLSRTSSPESGEEEHSGSDAGSEGRRTLLRRPKKSREAEPAHVIVGVSRLHVVEMPSLKMGPIYWNAVHDTSSVVRGTWFYKDTMWPVESDLANQIEAGYEYMKPWTPAYIDELNSCIEIGPEAELKVAHQIWPTEKAETGTSRPGTGNHSESVEAEEEMNEAKEVASLAANRAAGVLEGFEPPRTGRLFARSSVIYANGRDAQILKSNQLPSAAKGRKPLGNIRKGKAVGIPLVRGFDMKAWEKINPLPNRAIPTPQNMPSGTTESLKRRKSCLACESTDERRVPTDLILVVHGIGQKLSERVESFHFTHAINAFRRQINVELNDDAVKPWLRQDLGGVMVLPINWRSTLKLGDGGPEPDPNQRASGSTQNQFTLKDITAESLPAVRNLISDVMLDIPYYLSHHKPKMIEAVITEANRVYRTWCVNNPGFHESGRVHLLAHSLGSVMALDILSKQPTKLPPQGNYPLTKGKLRNDILEFDTKSLFFCGSPAGFFLLLNRAPLIPRKGREKTEAEDQGTNTGISGQAGTFGCLAVDNLYNIMHYNDPIAYRINACVDVDYAASLQTASVPGVTSSWGQYLGSFLRGKTIASSKTMTGLNELPRRPTTARMPTTVEMETHDFTKEEVAEKRMFLLNDNGQIDYTLPSGGGPLEIQYLNMLGAHSSYWTRQDFIRFLVVEVGRKPGRTEAVPGFKAVKKALRKT